MSKVGADNKRAIKTKEKEIKSKGKDKLEENKKEEESEIFIDESGSDNRGFLNMAVLYRIRHFH
jgi:hypothetical protein